MKRPIDMKISRWTNKLRYLTAEHMEILTVITIRERTVEWNIGLLHSESSRKQTLKIKSATKRSAMFQWRKVLETQNYKLHCNILKNKRNLPMRFFPNLRKIVLEWGKAKKFQPAKSAVLRKMSQTSGRKS